MKCKTALSPLFSVCRLLGVLALPLILTHCRSTDLPFPSAPESLPNMAVIHTAHVDHVVVAGNVHLILSTQPRHQHLTFRMPTDHPSQPRAWISGNTLYIHNTRHGAQPISMTLTIGKKLASLSTKGTASVTAHHLLAHHLTVIDASSGLVSLQGTLDIQRIYASAYSHLRALWVQSPKLVVYANDHAHVQLAGVTHAFYIRTTGAAHLDAQALRAGTITINSVESSQAKLFPLHSFQGFAHDQSIQYLYHKPPHINQHTWDMGNIFMQSYRP